MGLRVSSMGEYRQTVGDLGELQLLCSPWSHASKTKRGESHMIAGRMNLLAIIIIFLALATAGAVLYAAWELSSDKPADRSRSRAGEADAPDDPPGAEKS